MNKRERTIRELGGEIWAEMRGRVSESEANFEVKSRIVDIAMGVLARYEGAILTNDEGLPVAPLPVVEPEIERQ